MSIDWRAATVDPTDDGTLVLRVGLRPDIPVVSADIDREMTSALRTLLSQSPDVPAELARTATIAQRHVRTNFQVERGQPGEYEHFLFGNLMADASRDWAVLRRTLDHCLEQITSEIRAAHERGRGPSDYVQAQLRGQAIRQDFETRLAADEPMAVIEAVLDAPKDLQGLGWKATRNAWLELVGRGAVGPPTHDLVTMRSRRTGWVFETELWEEVGRIECWPLGDSEAEGDWLDRSGEVWLTWCPPREWAAGHGTLFSGGYPTGTEDIVVPRGSTVQTRHSGVAKAQRLAQRLIVLNGSNALRANPQTTPLTASAITRAMRTNPTSDPVEG